MKRFDPLPVVLDRLRELGSDRMREAFEIEAEGARAAGALGFLARILVQATLPHRRPDAHEFERSNGRFTLHLNAPPSVGLPYGVYPRLVLAWLNTEAVRTRSRHLCLGRTFTSFMAKLGLPPVTGKRGTSARLREQLHRLFSTSIRCTYADETGGHAAGQGFMIAHEHELWWSPHRPGEGSLWSSTVSLSSEFFREVIDHAVPIDLRALRILKRSALALDIYAWLTYRLSYLTKPTCVPWVALEAQFGSHYARRRDFRAKFLARLVDVLAVYPQARVSASDHGLTLDRSPSHVQHLLPDASSAGR